MLQLQQVFFEHMPFVDNRWREPYNWRSLRRQILPIIEFLVEGKGKHKIPVGYSTYTCEVCARFISPELEGSFCSGLCGLTSEEENQMKIECFPDLYAKENNSNT